MEVAGAGIVSMFGPERAAWSLAAQSAKRAGVPWVINTDYVRAWARVALANRLWLDFIAVGST